MTRRTLALSMAATLLTAGCGSPEAAHSPETPAAAPDVEAYGPPQRTPAELALLHGGSVWKVDVEHCGPWGAGGGGTAFSIGGGLLITSAHVVEDASTITITDRSGTIVLDATVHGTSKDVDIAVIRTDGDAGAALSWAEPDLLEEGMPVVSLSFPSPLHLLSVAPGHVNTVVRREGAAYELVTDDLTDRGSSGGPLLDMHGRVAGIVTEFLGGMAPFGVSLTYAAVEDELAAILSGERDTDTLCEGPSASRVSQKLREMCAGGSFWACDELYLRSPYGSDDESYAADCGGAAPGTDMFCVEVLGGGASKFGDDQELDRLAAGCIADEDGWADSCDLLYAISPAASEYETIGETCGGRTDGTEWCTTVHPG